MRQTLFFLALMLIMSNELYAQSAAISIDGNFDDWGTNLVKSVDDSDSKSNLDLKVLQVTNDEGFLYVKVEAAEEFDLTDNLMVQGLILCIDGDNNPSTGYKVRPDLGAELMIRFRERIVEFYKNGVSNLKFGDISLRSAPTVTSRTFEIAIGRNVKPDGSNSLFTSNTIKILALDTLSGDVIPSDNKGLSYTFDSEPVRPYSPVEIQKFDSNLLRIIAYNVKRDAISDGSKQPHFKKIITALNPDIIAYSECSNTSATAIKGLMDSWLPLGTSEGWHVAKKSGSDLITASKWPITQQWTNLPRQYPVLIDLPSNYESDLLLTNAHLNCCTADQARQDQADAYAAFVLDAKSSGGQINLPEGTPMVYVGDLNLVGYAQQLKTLLKGDIQNTNSYGQGGALDWDDSDLTDENYLQTDVRMNYTWRNDFSAFPPGKLDFIIYTDAVMESQKSFIVQTEVMSDARLQKYGWTRNATLSASDHFPVVTDFKLKEKVGVGKVAFEGIRVYPNPTDGRLAITVRGDSEASQVRIYSSTGELLALHHIKRNVLEIKFDYPVGFYFLEISGRNGGRILKKVLKR